MLVEKQPIPLLPSDLDISNGEGIVGFRPTSASDNQRCYKVGSGLIPLAVSRDTVGDEILLFNKEYLTFFFPADSVVPNAIIFKEHVILQTYHSVDHYVFPLD